LIYKKTKLGLISSIKGGKRLPKEHQFLLTKTAHPYIRTRNIRCGKVSNNDLVYITEETYKKISQSIVKTNDVCLTIVGRNIGDIGIVPQILNGANLIENAAILTELKNFNPIFLKYSLMMDESKRQIKNLASGSAQLKLSLYKIKNIEIPNPPLMIQDKIVSILSNYDDLIKNNLRRIKILEELLMIIYRQWFVNFRFSGHENIGLVDSLLGKIPKGWKVIPFSEIFEIKYGNKLPMKDIKDNGLYKVYGAGRILGYYDEFVENDKVTLITCRGCSTGTVWRTREPAFITNNTFRIQPKAEFSYMSYFFVEQLLKNSDISRASSGSAQPQITKNNISKVPVLLPDSENIEKFQNLVKDFPELIDKLHYKNHLLKESRDILLQKLISGEIDLLDLVIK